jgi:predicted nucleic acid-binding protein
LALYSPRSDLLCLATGRVYDASYVALAEQLDIPLITVDRAILDAAPGPARLPGTG